MTKDPYDVMDLKALRCFWAMAKHLSFTRAGIELGISETAVSQRVKSLESYLRIKLYEARGGRVRLTPAGERTFERATTTFGELEEFERNVARAEESVEITLCTYDAVLRYLLPEVVGRFAKVHPLARLRLLSRSAADCVQLIRTNEADVAITGVHDVPEDLVVERIASYPGYVLLPMGHSLARRGAAEFWSRLNEETVRRYPLIISEGQTHAQPMREALARLSLPLVVGLEVSTIDTLKHYVQRGLGIAAVSGLCLTDADRSRFEMFEAPPDVGGVSTYGIVMRRDKHRSRPLQTLLDLIGEISRRHPGSVAPA